MDLPKRKSIRLKDYDYGQNGAYCVTICADKYDGTMGRKIWQFRYHDRIIRNEKEYLRIWQYIDENPAKWAEDEYYVPPQK